MLRQESEQIIDNFFSRFKTVLTNLALLFALNDDKQLFQIKYYVHAQIKLIHHNHFN